MNVSLIGESSNLSKKLINVIGRNKVTTFGRSENADIQFDAEDFSIESIQRVFKENYEVYIFNIGFLQPKRIVDQTESEVIKSLSINALFIIKSCEYILNNNENARIFIIGSESGRKGSFDTSYFLSKAMLRAYVRQRALKKKDQQLILISPSTIEDSRMTSEREDRDVVDRYRREHPKGCFLYNDELVNYLTDIISNKSTYLTNCEIEINGGKFARMS
ncbi:SDR family oxidoreductase [Vibrio comitans]